MNQQTIIEKAIAEFRLVQQHKSLVKSIYLEYAADQLLLQGEPAEEFAAAAMDESSGTFEAGNMEKENFYTWYYINFMVEKETIAATLWSVNWKKHAYMGPLDGIEVYPVCTRKRDGETIELICEPGGSRMVVGIYP